MTLDDLVEYGGEAAETGPTISAQAQEAGSEGFSVGQTIKNIPKSAGAFAGGLLEVAKHPIQTAKIVGSLAAGGVEKLIPGRQAEEATFDSLVGFYKERYGSVNQFLSTLQEDPVGVAADISTFASGGGAALRGASLSGKIKPIANTAKKFTKLGEVTNPLSITKAFTPASKAVLGDFSRRLEKWSLRLTPTQKVQLGEKVNTISDYIATKGIIGSPENRFAKATNLYNAMEDSLDGFFSQMSKGSTIKRESLVRGLQTLKGQFRNERDAMVIDRQIDDFIKTIKTKQPESIEYKNLNKLKRSVYANAYNKAGNKVIDDVEHAIGDVLNNQLKEGLHGLKINGRTYGQFQEEYSKLIEARKLLKLASGRNEIGPWSSRIVGGLIGGALGGDFTGAGLGALLGPTAIENAPITTMRSALSSGFKKVQQSSLPKGVSNLKAPITGTERAQEALGSSLPQ